MGDQSPQILDAAYAGQVNVATGTIAPGSSGTVKRRSYRQKAISQR
ncbi:hypothetical protein NKJ46_22955 [Mesorhizobium sp. M0166]